jgi:CheY-like chemotaxis protein
MKILVIDDEHDVAVYLEMVLSDAGYDVTAVLSCKEAIAFLEDSIPDLICLDVMMPGESGMHLYSQLKKDERYKNIPVFIISAVEKERDFNIKSYIDDETVPPPDKYLEKPITVSSFLKAVEDKIGEAS